jgi:hypothetical protein
MEVSGQRNAQAPLYPWGKETRFPLSRRLDWTQRLKEKSFAYIRDRTPVVQSVVRHYTD